MKYLTREEVLQEIEAGNSTIKGLAAKFGLTTGSMKGVLAKLEISLQAKEPDPNKMYNLAASEEDEWNQLYEDYKSEDCGGTQALFLIAQCRIKDGMTAAQARKYMEDNFHYQIVEYKFKKKRRQTYDKNE